MVDKNITIGYDFICSWKYFITDSDWHKTNAPENTLPVKIGDHVWMAFDTKVLKGTIISDNCIVSTGSVLHRSIFNENTLIAGNPAKEIKNNINWSRNS